MPHDSPGFYLISPHAELIAAGKKSMIVKTVDYSNLCDEERLICGSGLCFGTLKMKPPMEASLDELNELYPLHRITPDEIKDWGWTDKDTFFLYDLYDVSIWDKPRHADIPQGVQFVIKSVKLTDADKDQDCGKAWEVLFANGMAMLYFEKEEDADHFIASGKKDPGWFDFNRKRYTWVRRERKAPHHCWPVNKKPVEWAISEKDSLSKEELSNRECLTCDLAVCSKECFNAHPGSMIALTKLFNSLGARVTTSASESDAEELATVNPSGVEIGEEIKRDELLRYFKSFYRTKPYVSLIGGICNHDKTKGDIDFFINSNHRDIATEFRIIRMFPQQYWYRFGFRYPYQEKTHPGKFTNHLDIYDEKIEVIRDPKLVLMSVPKKVELFKFAPLLKPAHGHYKGEEYSIDALIEVVNAKPEWYEKGTYVQKKFDGVHVRCDVQKNYESGFDVIIWSEEGNDITKNLPTLRKELEEASKGHAISIVGELESWSDEKHQSRQQTTAIIHTKEVHPNEKNVILNAFDSLYYDKDIHLEPHSERLKSHAKIKNTEHIKKAPYTLIHNATELRKAVQHYSTLPGSEGAYLKRADFPYELDGKSLLNLKYKNTFSIDAKVVDVHEVKGANAFNYLCVIDDDVPIGRTYNTSIKVSPGAILKVEFVNLSQYTDPDSKEVWFNWWSPHVIMAREDKRKPDNLLTAKKLVEASHGTVAEKKWPKRYQDADPWCTEDGGDPYLVYPDESKKWKGMVHCHGRGRSVHLDFRAQISADYATGWTLYIPKGLSKVPKDYAEFVRLVDAEIMPIVKETMSDPMKKFNCGKKAPEPAEWLTYKGMVQPGEVGATKHEPGFFYIIDSFEVQFGAQKSYFHEYFCNGKIFNGRIVFRLLENREEWKKTDEGLMTWMMFNALKTPTPYVLSTRAVKKAWCPPFNASALPRNIRTKIPTKFLYWKIKDASKRRTIRDELVSEIKKKLLKVESTGQGDFKFIKQTWRGQKVIRAGPSRTLYYFILKHDKTFFSLALNTSLLSSVSATGLPFPHHISLWSAEGEVPPGTKLNPTKATPSEIEVLDQGKATVLIEDEVRKFILKGKHLKGVWFAFQQEGSNLWSIQKSEPPKPKEK